MTKRNSKRGKEPLSLNECIPHAPKRVDNPVFQSMDGKNYDDEGDCREANMKFVLNMIVEHDEKQERWIGHDGAPEEVVEFLLRNRGQLIVAMCAHGEAGGCDKSNDAEEAFREFMRTKFGRGWDVSRDIEQTAIRNGLREAFLAGQAWYVGR